MRRLEDRLEEMREERAVMAAAAAAERKAHADALAALQARVDLLEVAQRASLRGSFGRGAGVSDDDERSMVSSSGSSAGGESLRIPFYTSAEIQAWRVDMTRVAIVEKVPELREEAHGQRRVCAHRVGAAGGPA